MDERERARAPVTEEQAVEMGADGYAPDAGRAASVAKNLVYHLIPLRKLLV
jgi:hypothetical protein